MACPECGCRDLRIIHIDREGKPYHGPLDVIYVFPRDINKPRKYADVARCFRCGWREETPWEAGKRMAKKASRRLKIGR